MNENNLRFGRKDFLIVDDNRTFRRALRRMVESHPQWFVVAEACDGREAVQLAQLHSPDVVLIDIVMPVMNGVEATKRIKQYASATRVIAFSAYHEEEFRVQGIQAGADYFVWKEELDGTSLEYMLGCSSS
jgi:DNA-binding NarL/FixJ family response regulator